jgi:hypothetical protein
MSETIVEVHHAHHLASPRTARTEDHLRAVTLFECALPEASKIA